MKPKILFVCVKNGGKSQIAGALARLHGGDNVEVATAGTKPGESLNEESRAAVEELGATFDGEYTKPIENIDSYDRIIVLGEEAVVDFDRAETWIIDEPSLAGIEGMERMRLVRDDIDAKVKKLLSELGL